MKGKSKTYKHSQQCMHIVSLFCNKIFVCSFCINGILIFHSYNVHILYIISANAAIFKQIIVSETIHISTGTECLNVKYFCQLQQQCTKCRFKKNERLQIYHFQIHLLPYPELNSELILLAILSMKTSKVPFLFYIFSN